MKTLPFFWLFIFSHFNAGAQVTEAFNRAIQIPESETYNTASIAKYIQVNFRSDREKLQAIYNWVTYNIKYGKDSMYVINAGIDSNARITTALRRRKGVCENFAAIFNDIAVKCGIRSFEISGYTKQYGTVDKTAHIWCVVYLDGLWLFCDPTWDAGYNGQTKYFLVPPSEFIESHMPFDPLWQCLDHLVSHREFYNGYYRSKEKPFFNYADSLEAYTKMTKLQQFESAAARIRNAGIYNDLIKTMLSWLQMETSIDYQERNRVLYNDAVSAVNHASDLLNIFIQYRNDGFKPLKKDEEIQSMLSPIDGIFRSAYLKLDELDGSPANFQYNSGSLRDKLEKLNSRLQEQTAFLKRYFSKSPPNREKVFYN